MQSHVAFDICNITPPLKFPISAACLLGNGVLYALQGSRIVRHVRFVNQDSVRFVNQDSVRRMNQDDGRVSEHQLEHLVNQELAVQLTKQDAEIKMMEVIEEVKLLLILADEVMHLLDLATGKLVYVFEQCKSARYFCTYAARDNTPLMLAVCMKKKLCLFYLQKRTFICFRDFSFTDRLVSAVFLTSSTLCMGFKEKYALLNFGNWTLKESGFGSVKEIFGVGKNTARPVYCILHNENIDIMNNELLLARDSIGISVSFQGKPTRAGPTVDWGELPQCCVCLGPYLVSMVSNRGLIIRNLFTSTLCQGNVSNALKTTPSMYFLTRPFQSWAILVSQNSLHRFDSVSITQQVEHLDLLQEYVEALSLLTNAPSHSVEASEKEALTAMMKSKHAFALFHQGEFEEAFSLFQDARVDLRVILVSLFPNLLPATYDVVDFYSSPPTWTKKLVCLFFSFVLI